MPMPKKPRSNCLACGKEVKRHVDKYCNNICQQIYFHNRYIERWLSGLEDGMSGSTAISNYIRKYFFEKYNSSCQLCGWSKVHPKTKQIPLEIHHIDGNHKNNKFENLQLLCPNCHSLTDTNGSLNNGNGRHYTRVYK